MGKFENDSTPQYSVLPDAEVEAMAAGLSAFREEYQDRIRESIVLILQKELGKSEIPENLLDLDVDSLDWVITLNALEEMFGIVILDAQASKVRTLTELVNLVEASA